MREPTPRGARGPGVSRARRPGVLAVFGGWGQGVGEGCMVFTEGLEAATGGTLAMMTAATVRRARCWSASGLAPFALLRRTYREWSEWDPLDLGRVSSRDRIG